MSENENGKRLAELSGILSAKAAEVLKPILARNPNLNSSAEWGERSEEIGTNVLMAFLESKELGEDVLSQEDKEILKNLIQSFDLKQSKEDFHAKIFEVLQGGKVNEADKINEAEKFLVRLKKFTNFLVNIGRGTKQPERQAAISAVVTVQAILNGLEDAIEDARVANNID